MKTALVSALSLLLCLNWTWSEPDWTQDHRPDLDQRPKPEKRTELYQGPNPDKSRGPDHRPDLNQLKPDQRQDPEQRPTPDQRADLDQGPNPDQRPHLIFFLIDDQGYNDIGYHNPRILTPTLDRLASEGVRLESYYVQPICTPTRSQLLTGRYQIHTGLQHSIIRPQQPNCLPPHTATLPQRLQQLGYSTHLVGKWHLGFCRKSCLPTRKGFDTFFGSLTGSVDYYSYGSCDGPGVCGYDLQEDEGVAWGHEGRYSTALFTQRARKILQEYDPRGGRPLFLMLSLQAVHTPLLAPRSYLLPYRSMMNPSRRKMAAMVATVDAAVRNVTYALRKLGLYKNSVIVYSTDNGGQPFTGGSNWPLRGRKGTYWEGGIRGVGFVHSPLLSRRRRLSTDLIHVTDWFPTMVRLAGGEPEEGLDGYDVWPTISEGKPSPRTEILHNIDPLHRTPKDQFKDQFTDQSKDRPKKRPRKRPKKRPKNQPKNRPKDRAKAPWNGSGKAPVKPQKTPKKKKKILRQKLQQKSAFKLKKKHRELSIKAKQERKNLRSETRGVPRETGGVPRETGGIPRETRGRETRGVQTETRGVQREARVVQREARVVQRETVRRETVQRETVQRKTDQRETVQRETDQKETVQRETDQKETVQRETVLGESDSQPLNWTLSPSALWDTSVQAAIRVGDWKLLTGDPGHGDWVPPQLFPSLPGRWWNLERSVSSWHKSPEYRGVWLFNVSADPYERWDVSERRPDVVETLLRRLVHYNSSAVPVRFPPDDSRADPRRRRGAWEPWEEEEEEEEEAERASTQHKTKKKKKRRGKCHLCKLKAFFHKLDMNLI
ncbi:unnamed protein product [Knipowitschia caucasica]